MDETKPDKPPEGADIKEKAAPPGDDRPLVSADTPPVAADTPKPAEDAVQKILPEETPSAQAHLMDEDQDAAPAPSAPPPRKTAKRKPAASKPASSGRWRLWTPAVLLFLSLCYLVAEIEFNMSLLDVAGSVRSDPVKMEDLQVFGRAVSASGCFLLVLGFFASSGFHVTPGRLRWFYYMVGLVAIMPLLMIFGATIAGPDSVPIDPTASDIMLALLPALGIGYGSAIGRGRNAFVNVVSLMLIVWPAVFLGQKLLIEQALIERTDWQQRVNARYVLMLRSILEDCTINLDDLALCDAEDEQDSVKSARIILGSMWMLSPERIRSDMEDNKDKLVQSVAARGMWFSPREQYDQYISKVADERSKVHQQMIEAYFVPYKKASDDYARAMSNEVLRAESDKAATEIEKEIDRGWRQYQQGVREYKQQLSASGVNMLKQMAPYKDRLRDFCATRNCPPALRGKERGLVADAASDAEREFSRRSGGYTPDIETRAEFIAAYPTQVRLRNRVQEYISNRLPHSGFVLPANWFYERESFQKAVETLMKQEIDRRWKEKAPKDMPPGLSMQAFFEASGMPPLPEMEELVMTPDAFFKRMIMPRYREILDRMLGDIENEKQLYANGESLAEKGRDYARAVLIPAIALIISLLVVILTMLRWWNIMVRSILAALMRRHMMPAALRVPAQIIMVGVFVGMIVFVPRFMPNPYAGATYERYRDEAMARAPVTAQVLDWAIHTQPAVYRLGSPIRDVLDKLHEKPAAKSAVAAP
ncbi:MAG: hypothetical protein ACK4PK_04455 [Alphaproteobacteria bacterium]